MKKVYKEIVGITGASGILGKYFIKKYKNKFDFRIFKKRIEKNKDVEFWIKKNKNIKIFIHMAAIASISEASKSTKKTYLINTLSSIKLLKLIKRLNLSHLKYFLFISSSHVYKPSFNPISENSKKLPASIYGHSKLKVEKYINNNTKNFNFQIGVARIFNYYSKDQKKGFFIPDIKKKISYSKKKIYFEKVNTFRDYSNIDFINKILYFMIKNKISKPLNVGSGKSINLKNIINQIKKKMNSNIKIDFEKKKYPGLVSNTKLLRKLGFKNKINKFVIN